MAAFKTAFVNLAAYDMTLRNKNVDSVGTALKYPTFKVRDRLQLIAALELFAHNEFQPTVTGDWEEQIVAALNSNLSSFTPG
ncbi:hypothetical protein WN72_24845 [Bradyrhizobium arachidis]|uniref:Uncharacterized protein n=1 Tax=Bradyrhizobium arachidis TaxID=858423 RepID=A0AAE7TI54_9BRAD|nr:hypothetical protein WN72_24845 [Bradyrhizobium arachidis]